MGKRGRSVGHYMPRSERQRKLIAFVQSHQPCGLAEMAKEMGVAIPTVRDQALILKRQGELDYTLGKHRSWVVAPGRPGSQGYRDEGPADQGEDEGSALRAG
jgi:predicted ArsR family transcriptional regulator